MAGAKTKNQGKDVVEVEASSPASEQNESSLSRHGLQQNLMRLKKAPCCQLCFKIWYVMLSLKAMILAITMLIVTLVSAIATKAYDTEQSSRMVAMLILCLTAAMALSTVISGLVGLFKNKAKALSVVAILLIALACFQAIVAGFCTNVSPKEEISLGKALAESFKLAKEGNQRHVKIWDSTQNDLNCCGVYGPDDYRSQNTPYYFAPNVPISCCPSYNSARPDLVQEKEREVCRAKKTYYDIGCKNLVVEVFKETSKTILGVTVVLIIIEILLSIVSLILVKKEYRRRKHAGEH